MLAASKHTCSHFRCSLASSNALNLKNRFFLVNHLLELRIVHVILLPFWNGIELQLLGKLHNRKGTDLQ
eukprot:jgi/Botrbrau1/8811/Bobra.0335s0001.1